MAITWSGRAYVCEEYITPEQYKVFFDPIKNGIKYDTANAILVRSYREGCEEEVSCKELNPTCRAIVKRAIESGKTCGWLNAAGLRLGWCWEPELACEGVSISVAD